MANSKCSYLAKGINVVEKDYSNIINLTGEIVSIYEKEGKRLVKLKYNQGFVDVSFQDIKNVYLGDKVIIDSNLTIKKISPLEEKK